jgi:hypothetical protein
MLSSPYKYSNKSTNRFKSCAHLKSLNVCHFGMVETTALDRVEVIFNGITYIQDFIQIDQTV